MLNLSRLSSARPSAALVISIIALIASLTGTAVAAGVLPAGSVTSTQLRTWAVTAPKIKDGAVTARKLQANSVDTNKVVNGSLRAADFKAGQLPTQAYAQVTGGTSPTFVVSATKNFTKVVRSGVGSYCLTPAAGISPTARPAIVSVQSPVDPMGIPVGQFAVWEAAATGCAAGDYKVRTYRAYTEAMGADALADDVSFVVSVA